MSLCNRELNSFDRMATLRPSTCRLFGAMLDVRPGDVVLDPLCGIGSVQVYVAKKFVCYGIGGDLAGRLVGRPRSQLSPVNCCGFSARAHTQATRRTI
jgi:tRNA G10  N-methylase Trm11